MKNKQHTITAALIVLIILENLFLYYFYTKGLLTQGKNAFGLFLSSISFGALIIYKFYNAQVTLPAATTAPAKNKLISYALIVLVIVGFIAFGVKNNNWFKANGLDYRVSDIIPVIQIICRRFLSGHYAYAAINDYGYILRATYMPMQWMPFTIAELLHFDYRWIPYVVWCVTAVVFCVRSIKIPSPWLRALVPVIIFTSYYFLQRESIGIVQMTIELLISAYYMILIIGLNNKSGIVQGIAISLCLMSRYSIVLWIPLYCFVVFASGHRKQVYMAVAMILVITIFGYVLPFLSKDWSSFYIGYKQYDLGAKFEWTHLNDQGQPYHLYSGTGFAYYIYTRFAGLDLMDRIKILQRIHLIGSVSVTVVMGIWFWFNRKKINYNIFLFSSFKIYLAFFLFLIQVPYVYLMCVGNFVSIAIFCEQARYLVTRPEKAT